MTEKMRISSLIGRNIKYYRLLNNLNKTREQTLTQEKLAELAEVSVTFVSRLESAKNSQGISLYKLWRISKILNVPIQNFFEETP